MNVKQIQKKLAKKQAKENEMDISKYDREIVLRDTYIFRHRRYGKMTRAYLMQKGFQEQLEAMKRLRGTEHKKEN